MAAMSVEFASYARTDRGHVRAGNEDCYALEPPLMLVADGLGGHPGGADASRIAVHTAAAVLTKEPAGVPALCQAWEAADSAIQDEAANSGRPGMGTTLVGGVLSPDGGTLYLANVGDSRAYVLDSAGLRQLTEDDNEAAEMVRRGALTREQARLHPGRFWISQALGLGPVDVRTQTLPTRGERLLLCSDGLLDLPDERVGTLLAEADTPRQAADRLVDAVLNDTEASDNVTVLVADLPGG